LVGPDVTGQRTAPVTHDKRIGMTRLLVLTLTLMTLRFGGAAALHQDATDAVQSVHAGVSSLSNQVTSDIVNLPTTLSDSPSSGS
jgi:hypothetical protein